MNTIVATRAGKDLISTLASGLLTIGSRFGGALDEAASMFSGARDTGLTPREFVDNCRKQAYFWYRPQDQDREQPKSACRARQGLRAQELPQPRSPRLCSRRG